MSMNIGNPAESARSVAVAKKREQTQQDLKMKLEQAERESNRVTDMSSKFAARSDDIEEKLKVNTYGLLTFEQMKAHHEAIEAERERLLKAASAPLVQVEKKKKAAQPAGALSFSIDEAEEEDDEDRNVGKSKTAGDEETNTDASFKKKRFGKNPEVDTSFLPDKDREAAEALERQKLLEEVRKRREQIKQEKLEVVYSYWDGSGNRQKIEVRKGNTIAEFLDACLKDLRAEFPLLRPANADSMIFVKDDIILPAHMSFFDLMVSGARGQHGALFSFSIHDNTTAKPGEQRIEKDESHPGKVLLRSWYNQNRHVFPASRWEPYDPEKIWNDKIIVKDRRLSSSFS